MCEMKENRSSRWDETENWQLERNSVALCAAGLNSLYFILAWNSNIAQDRDLSVPYSDFTVWP